MGRGGHRLPWLPSRERPRPSDQMTGASHGRLSRCSASLGARHTARPGWPPHLQRVPLIGGTPAGGRLRSSAGRKATLCMGFQRGCSSNDGDARLASMPTRTQSRHRRPPCPAVQALASSGSSVGALAQALGVHQSAASFYLSGRRSLPDRFPAVVADLVGEEAAAEITALIPTRSAA